MTERAWLDARVVLAVHDELLAEHGGPAGVRDLALLDSALARPRNLAAYGSPDAFDLAASYAYGIARNHPFADGNKRTAFAAAATFLWLNGHDLAADEAATVQVMLDLSAGTLSEADFAAWQRAHATPLPTSGA